MSIGVTNVVHITSVVVGIRQSRETMESALRFSLWLSCSAFCGCTVQFWIGRLCCSCYRWIPPLALWVLVLLLVLPCAVCALSSHPTAPLSSSHTSECLPWQQAFSDSGLQLQLPNLLSWYCLYMSLKWRGGLATGLAPVASSPWSMSVVSP